MPTQIAYDDVVKFEHPELSRIRSQRSRTYRALDKRDEKSSDGFVYIVEDRDNPGVLKIGKSRDPVRRLAGAQTFIYRANLYLVHAKYFTNMHMAEKLIHTKLSTHRDDREWFHVDSMTALRTLQEIDE